MSILTLSSEIILWNELASEASGAIKCCASFEQRIAHSASKGHQPLPGVTGDKRREKRTDNWIFFVFQQAQQLFEVQESNLDLFDFDEWFLTSRAVVSISASPSLIADASSSWLRSLLFNLPTKQDSCLITRYVNRCGKVTKNLSWFIAFSRGSHHSEWQLWLTRTSSLLLFLSAK